jgi:16S rRNA (cytidine1402-2'-O)-methyltransferase
MATLPLAHLHRCYCSRYILARSISPFIPSPIIQQKWSIQRIFTTSAVGQQSDKNSPSNPTASTAGNIDTTDSTALLDPGLYIVATPIGNLEDITLRALRVLRTADKILCEDTRRTGQLLNHFSIKTPMESYHLHNENNKLNKVVDTLRRGAALALVSDAGIPAINDPGGHLIAAAIEQGLPVIPIPGPSATLTALTASGLSMSSFTFCGFIEAKSGSRVKQFTKWKDLESTLIFFVSPHALLGALEDAIAVFGAERRCCLARELTKTHEEFWRSSLTAALVEFKKRGPRGEFTLVVEGSSAVEAREEATDEEVMAVLKQLIEEGTAPSQAARQVALDLNVNKKRVYALSLQLK